MASDMTDIATILALSRQGKSAAEIAALCLTSWQRVQEIVASHGLPRAVARERRAAARPGSNGASSLASTGSAARAAEPVLSRRGEKHSPCGKSADFAASCVRHWPALRRYALSLTHDPDRAEDLVQDTFLRALAKRHLFRDGTELAAWLIHMLRNLLVSGVLALAVAYVENVTVPLAQQAKAAQHAAG